jgi:hypothetical protein
MPSSAVHALTNPDDYPASVRATRAEVTVSGRGHFAAKLVRIDLNRVRMQRFFDNLPRVAHSANFAGRAIIPFRTQPRPILLSSGVELQATNIIRHKDGGRRPSGTPTRP